MEIKEVLVLGNGESRNYLELNSFLSKMISVGCNAIYRDYNVNHLVCCDRRMAIEAITHAPKSTTIYTRERWSELLNRFPNVVAVPQLPYNGSNREDEPFQWGSGSYAVLLGCMLGDEISMIGFDLWSQNYKVNNVYKGTENYSSEDSHAVDPNYWIYQIGKLFEYFPDKKFTIYNTNSWQLPDAWKFNNVKLVSEQNDYRTIR